MLEGSSCCDSLPGVIDKHVLKNESKIKTLSIKAVVESLLKSPESTGTIFAKNPFGWVLGVYLEGSLACIKLHPSAVRLGHMSFNGLPVHLGKFGL